MQLAHKIGVRESERELEKSCKGLAGVLKTQKKTCVCSHSIYTRTRDTLPGAYLFSLNVTDFFTKIIPNQKEPDF